MVIGSKKSSCKVKAEGWKVSRNRGIKGIAVGVYPYWYRGTAEVPRYRRGGQDESAVFHCSLYLTNWQYAVGRFLSDELSLPKYIGSLEWKKQMAHGRCKWHRLSLCLISLPFIDNLVGGGGRKPRWDSSLSPHPPPCPGKSHETPSKVFHHCWASRMIGMEKRFFCGRRDWHVAVQREEALKRSTVINFVAINLGQRSGRRLYNTCILREAANGLYDRLAARPMVSWHVCSHEGRALALPFAAGWSAGWNKFMAFGQFPLN